MEFVCADAAVRLARMNKMVDQVAKQEVLVLRNIGTSRRDLERRVSDAGFSA